MLSSFRWVALLGDIDVAKLFVVETELLLGLQELHRHSLQALLLQVARGKHLRTIALPKFTSSGDPHRVALLEHHEAWSNLGLIPTTSLSPHIDWIAFGELEVLLFTSWSAADCSLKSLSAINFNQCLTCAAWRTCSARCQAPSAVWEWRYSPVSFKMSIAMLGCLPNTRCAGE